MSEGLLEALLPDQRPRARHGRGRDVLQGGGGREGGVPKTEQTHGSTEERDGYKEDIKVRDNTRDTGEGRKDLEKMKV